MGTETTLTGVGMFDVDPIKKSNYGCECISCALQQNITEPLPNTWHHIFCVSEGLGMSNCETGTQRQRSSQGARGRSWEYHVLQKVEEFEERR